MKALIYVCFVVFVTHKASGQTTEPICTNAMDFAECGIPWECNQDVSTCTCFDKKPYCRCYNRKGEFYIDENCSQRWTLVSFALVACLPGIALAILVGTIVYVVMVQLNKSRKSNAVNTASSKEQEFPGNTFASDLSGRPAPNIRPLPQNLIPMRNTPNSANSVSHDQPMGGPSRPYSMSGGTRDPPMEGFARPYSTSAGYGQSFNNPYARDSSSRNPYDNRNASLDKHNNYRQPASSHPYQDVNQSYPPAPNYPSDRGNPHGGFPRPHLNLQY